MKTEKMICSILLFNIEARYDEYRRDLRAKCTKKFAEENIVKIKGLSESGERKLKNSSTNISGDMSKNSGKEISTLISSIFRFVWKGTANEWSDIDVALLMREFIGDSFDFEISSDENCKGH
ncbi:MAG: hypothetical protein MZV70_15405 [Desulfobacterales bacterium]|nr:hypothetical protein [Desulfobacterales bacterium]